MGRGRGLSLFVAQGKATSADTGRLCTDIRKICGASFLNLQELNGTLRTRFLHQHDLFFTWRCKVVGDGDEFSRHSIDRSKRKERLLFYFIWSWDSYESLKKYHLVGINNGKTTFLIVIPPFFHSKRWKWNPTKSGWRFEKYQWNG